MRSSSRSLSSCYGLTACGDRESRRANATLRSHKLHERVHNLFNIHGEISKDFPRTLGDMFSISGKCYDH